MYIEVFTTIFFFFSQMGQYFRAGYRWFVQMISYRIDPLKQLCLLIYKQKHSWIPWGYKYLWKNSKVKRQFRIFVKHLPLPNLLRKRRKKEKSCTIPHRDYTWSRISNMLAWYTNNNLLFVFISWQLFCLPIWNYDFAIIS